MKNMKKRSRGMDSGQVRPMHKILKIAQERRVNWQ